MLSLQLEAQVAKIKSLYEKAEFEKCLKVREKQQIKDSLVLEAWLYDALVWTHFAEIERITSIKVFDGNKELTTKIEHQANSKIAWVVEDLPNFEDGKLTSLKVVLDLRFRPYGAAKTEQKIIEYEIRVF